MLTKLVFYLLLTGWLATVSFAQSVDQLSAGNGKTKSEGAPGSELYRQIARVDSIVFHAFNSCDSLTYRQYFTDDLEFYHDLGGLTVSLDKEMASLQEMCARGTHIRRELIKSSLEVYPLKNYGAVEIGTHRFFHTNKGQKEQISGTYRFVQVWQQKEGQWKIARVISYGHTNVKND